MRRRVLARWIQVPSRHQVHVDARTVDVGAAERDGRRPAQIRNDNAQGLVLERRRLDADVPVSAEAQHARAVKDEDGVSYQHQDHQESRESHKLRLVIDVLPTVSEGQGNRQAAIAAWTDLSHE